VQVVFLQGKLRSVLLAVGADRRLRVWDTVRCCLLASVLTGHRMGESVAAMALDSSGMRLATGELAAALHA
jgi:methylmalonyl-CoA mutase cobalamin-binding subunit